jgi:hypothetical protein
VTKLDILVRIEAFHFRAGAETRPGMDRDDTRGCCDATVADVSFVGKMADGDLVCSSSGDRGPPPIQAFTSAAKSSTDTPVRVITATVSKSRNPRLRIAFTFSLAS